MAQILTNRNTVSIEKILFCSLMLRCSLDHFWKSQQKLEKCKDPPNAILKLNSLCRNIKNWGQNKTSSFSHISITALWARIQMPFLHTEVMGKYKNYYSIFWAIWITFLQPFWKKYNAVVVSISKCKVKCIVLNK